MKMTEDIIAFYINVIRNIRNVEKQMIQIKFYATNVLENQFKNQEASSLTSTIIRSSSARNVKSSSKSPKLSHIGKLISFVRDALVNKSLQKSN